MEGKLPEVRLSSQPFKVVAPFEPTGDQPQAIASLAKGIEDGLRYQTLLGVTGSGKTFTMAKTIEPPSETTRYRQPASARGVGGGACDTDGGARRASERQRTPRRRQSER